MAVVTNAVFHISAETAQTIPITTKAWLAPSSNILQISPPIILLPVHLGLLPLSDSKKIRMLNDRNVLNKLPVQVHENPLNLTAHEFD
jgi:hypothetical protein